MRIESALYASREGLQAHGQAISVVGDNISNANTVGFKGSRIEFSNLLEVAGVQVQRIREDDGVGVIEQTGRSLDAAIAGGGYFVVGSSEQQYYSRAGNFSLSTDGDLVEASGKTVLGYKANSTTLEPINLFDVQSTGQATSAATINGNLRSQEAEKIAPPANPTSFQQIAAAASYVGSLTVYDSLGAARDVTMAYTKTGPGVWTAQAFIDGADVGSTKGTPVQLGGNATLTFNTSGTIEVANQAAATITATPAFTGGAAAGNFTIDLSQMNQFATGSQLTGVAQDGKISGSVKDFRFDSDGSLYAVLDSGTESFVARLPIATFRNEDGLERIGGNLYQASDAAGERVLGSAGEGVSGEINGASLERSTVDLAAQFVDLVLYQRGYQASSQTLSAASELLKSTIALIR